MNEKATFPWVRLGAGLLEPSPATSLDNTSQPGRNEDRKATQ